MAASSKSLHAIFCVKLSSFDILSGRFICLFRFHAIVFRAKAPFPLEKVGLFGTLFEGRLTLIINCGCCADSVVLCVRYA